MHLAPLHHTLLQLNRYLLTNRSVVVSVQQQLELLDSLTTRLTPNPKVCVTSRHSHLTHQVISLLYMLQKTKKLRILVSPLPHKIFDLRKQRRNLLVKVPLNSHHKLVFDFSIEVRLRNLIEKPPFIRLEP